MGIEKYHFIGLGGIGMSALARLLLQQGHKVRGSDAADSELLQALKKEGAEVHIGHQSGLSFEKTAVIYSSAIQETNVELLSAKKQGAPFFHRSELLSSLMQGKKNLLVTGTHGKTTTTALLAAVLKEAGLDPSLALGGYLLSLKTNGISGKGEYFVAEADESDGSFLNLQPFGAIVTNIGRDHLDYWKTQERLNQGFAQFISSVKKTEHLFWCADEAPLAALTPQGISYGFSSGAKLRIVDFCSSEAGIVFSVRWEGRVYSSIELPLLGRHNALNGAAVFGLSLSLGISEEVIRKAFQTFSGTHRRLEKKGEARSVSLYDDYGHHPTEIACTLKALRAHIRERRLVVLFQPHRYSRVSDLWERFFPCFEEADLVILTDIYSASETPIEGVTSDLFYAAMREKLGAKVVFIPRGSLEEKAAESIQLFDVVLTLGAGDITKAGAPILQNWKEKNAKLKVAVLCGGTSAEHEVSLMSAENIVKNLDPSLYEIQLFGVTKAGRWKRGPNVLEDLKQNIGEDERAPKLDASVLQELLRSDVAIPIFHGPQGEDGMMQAFLDTLQIPYVGCEYRGAVLCMQKAWTKYAALLNQIPTAPFIEMRASAYFQNPEDFLQKIEQNLSYPVWIKPVHLGSSIGVSRAANKEDAKRGAELAFLYDELLIAEKEIEGRQIEFAVLGNEFVRVIHSSEILNHGSFYDYEKKYGEQAMGTEIPAHISSMEEKVGFDLAERAYLACGCKGMARVDFFLDKQGHYWLNEINPFPGFTRASAYPKMCEAAGMSGQTLWNELLILAFQRSRSLSKIRGR